MFPKGSNDNSYNDYSMLPFWYIKYTTIYHSNLTHFNILNKYYFLEDISPVFDIIFKDTMGNALRVFNYLLSIFSPYYFPFVKNMMFLRSTSNYSAAISKNWNVGAIDI